MDMIWFWVGFNVFVLAMLALDLGVFHRKPHEIKFKEALAWTAAWIVLALAFNAAVYHWWGSQVGLQFLTGYLIEKSLSVDNVFVFLLIFTYFKVPAKYQHEVLFWGIIGALIFRALFQPQHQYRQHVVWKFFPFLFLQAQIIENILERLFVISSDARLFIHGLRKAVEGETHTCDAGFEQWSGGVLIKQGGARIEQNLDAVSGGVSRHLEEPWMKKGFSVHSKRYGGCVWPYIINDSGIEFEIHIPLFNGYLPRAIWAHYAS